MNEKRSSLEELVVLKVEDPLHGEGTQSPASSESPGGADLQVYLLEDHDNLCNGIFCCDATSVKNVLKMEIPTSLNESTAQSTAVAADSQLSDGVKRNRSRSSLPAFYPQTKISQDALAEVKVALTKMEGLPDSGWVLLDPVTGHFCVKADLDSVTAVMGREGRGDAPDGPGADPGVSCTQSVGMGVQMTTNSNTQTEAQITVTMSDDEVNLDSTAADGVEPNRVLTRSSKANRANSSSAKTTETNDVHSQRGCTTRSNGNRVAPRIDECVEKSANTASCPSGPPAPMRAVHTDSLSDPPMRAVHTDSLSDPPIREVHTDRGKGNDRLSKEACQDISGKVQQAKAKKDHTINVQASEASTSNNSPVESDQANFSAVEKDRKHCPFIEAKVYRAGHFIISQGSLTNRKKEVTKKSNGQIYTARVEVCDTSEQGFKVKEEHQGKQTVFECQHCAKTFPTLKSMQKHWKYHSPNKTHICSHCGKGYVYKCHLKIHMQSHTRERPHQCKQCGKRFIYRSNLKSHLVYHTGEKPHVCLQCGMAFSRHGYLINHVTIHSGLRPYGCLDCGKKFTTKGGLKRHEGIHLKKKTNG
ncbi:zinc finger protein 415-like [Clupea harengus]|uniref:Zinc finger protein 415-like n=1 Tax=Clupea harengus TaxID=7950 RepID=A0A6P8ED05_CLUHA|nr:zinc finger protein 415-like [Clupea harengus]